MLLWRFSQFSRPPCILKFLPLIAWFPINTHIRDKIVLSSLKHNEESYIMASWTIFWPKLAAILDSEPFDDYWTITNESDRICPKHMSRGKFCLPVMIRIWVTEIPIFDFSAFFGVGHLENGHFDHVRQLRLTCINIIGTTHIPSLRYVCMSSLDSQKLQIISNNKNPNTFHLLQSLTTTTWKTGPIS